MQPGGSIPIQRTLAERWSGASWVADPSGNVGTTDNLLFGAAAIPGTGVGLGRRVRPTAANVDQTLIEQESSG